ncbi:MAG: hypothetical protein ACRDH9_03010 [Actinomycetota bacterium]
MRRMHVMAAGVLAALLGGLVATIALADPRVAEINPLPRSAYDLPISKELAKQGVLWHGNDLGAGERVILVVGGAFPSRQAAEEANATIGFGDLQGYYVASIDQFDGLRAQMGGNASDFVLVTAFRTDRGAADFINVARANDAPAMLTPRLVNRGDEYVGLGQEQHPNGSGPLIGPLAGVST